MNSIAVRTVASRLPAAVFFTVVLTGCATGGASDPDYAAGEIRKVALVTNSTPPEVESIRFGISPGEAAVLNAPVNAAGGAWLGLAVCGKTLVGLLVWPVCLGAGAVVGVASDNEFVVSSPNSPEALNEAEASARAILETGGLQNQILERAHAYASKNVSYTVERAATVDSAKLSKQGFDTVLKVELTRIALRGSLQMEARARLVSLDDGSVLSEAQYGFSTLERSLQEWMANEARVLVDAIEEGLVSLAEDIVDEAFLLYHPSIPASTARWGPVPYYVLAPEYPSVEYSSTPFGATDASYPNVEISAVATMPPTLRWEQFPRSWESAGPDGTRPAITNVSYELKVFDLLRGEAWPQPGQEVYRATDLAHPEHRITVDLRPCTEYFWTVRARFELSGRTRVTEWAGAYQPALGPGQEPWKLRRSASVPRPSWFYFPIITPGEQSDCASGRPELFRQAREEEIRWMLLSTLAKDHPKKLTVMSVRSVKSANGSCETPMDSDMRPPTIGFFPARGWIFGSADERNRDLERKLNRNGEQVLSASDRIAPAIDFSATARKLDKVIDAARRLPAGVDYQMRLHREYALLYAEKLHADAVVTFWYTQRGAASSSWQDLEAILIDARSGDLYRSSGTPGKAEAMVESILCSYAANAFRSDKSLNTLARFSSTQHETALQSLSRPADKLIAMKVLCDDGLLSYEDYDERRQAYRKEGIEKTDTWCVRKPKHEPSMVSRDAKVAMVPPAFSYASGSSGVQKAAPAGGAEAVRATQAPEKVPVAEDSSLVVEPLRIGLFPLANLPANRFDSVFYDFVHQYAEAHPNMDLVFSDYDSRFESGLAGTESEIWGGTMTEKVPNKSAVIRGAKTVGADVAILISYKQRSAGWYADDFTFTVYVLDILENRTYKLSGTDRNYQGVIKTALKQAQEYRSTTVMRRERDAKPREESKKITIGILTPGFYRPTSPSNSEKEEQVHTAISRVIHSKPSLTLSYDYAMSGGVGPEDVNSVWKGTVIKKIPDREKVQTVGEDLGVNCLVLIWIKNMWARSEVDLYVADISHGSMYQQSGGLGEVESLMSAAVSDCEGPT